MHSDSELSKLILFYFIKVVKIAISLIIDLAISKTIFKKKRLLLILLIIFIVDNNEPLKILSC